MDFENYIGVAWLAFVIVWAVSAFFTKPVARLEPAKSALLHRSMMAAAALLLFTHIPRLEGLEARLIPNWKDISWVGLTLTVAGIGFAIWARFYLGGNWSSSVTVKQDHQLVRSGPYAFVRHPIYSGILLAFLGTALAKGEVRDLLALLIAAMALRIKSYTEEQFMAEQFGSQYSQYKREVRALIPFVW